MNVTICCKLSKLLKKTISASLFLIMPLLLSAQTKTLYQAQCDVVNWRFGMYIHFNMNTFNPGWGESRVNPKTFAPAKVDCGQWARAAKSAGIIRSFDNQASRQLLFVALAANSSARCRTLYGYGKFLSS